MPATAAASHHPKRVRTRCSIPLDDRVSAGGSDAFCSAWGIPRSVALPRVRVRADGRARRLPGGQRLHKLHRVRRGARFHAPDQPGGVQHSTRARDRQHAELAYIGDGHSGTVIHKAGPDYLDDGPEKPVRIWSRIGRRLLLAAGNSNGDVPMLQFTQHKDKPSLRLLVLHDDGVREFDYTAGAEQALEQADAAGWTVVSMKNDWTTIF